MIVILLVSVMIHELAHYLNARSVGIPVRAFSIGFGPVIWRKQWKGTEWRLSVVPLGGYVDLPGMAPKVLEDGTLEHPDEGMAKATLPQKVWVLIGGVIANFLLGIVLMASVIMLEPAYRSLTASLPVVTVIGEVQQGSPAEAAGLQTGDELLEVAGVVDPQPDHVVQMVRGDTPEVQEAGGLLTMVIGRDGEPVRTVTLEWPPAEGEALLGIGIGQTAIGADPVSFPVAVMEAGRFAVTTVPMMVTGFVRGFGAVLTGQQSEDLAGPVGVVALVNQATQVGLAPVLLLAAGINFSLAIFNLLPIPGLDGGRILLALIAGVRGKPFRPGQEETIHFFGIMAVLLLIVLITVGDVGRLFGS